MTDTERERAKQIADAAIAYIKAHPECLAAKSYSDLHDYCDANVIGGQDTYLDECAATIAAQNPGWSEDEVNDEALDIVGPVMQRAEQIVGMWLEMAHGSKPQVASAIVWEKRIVDAVEKASNAFWQSVVESFPEAEAGDFDPISTHQWEATCDSSVRLWLHYNVRKAEAK